MAALYLFVINSNYETLQQIDRNSANNFTEISFNSIIFSDTYFLIVIIKSMIIVIKFVKAFDL